MSTSGEHASPLHLPEELRYTCHNSGVCCTTFSEIPVDDATHRRLEQLEAEGRTVDGASVGRLTDGLVQAVREDYRAAHRGDPPPAPHKCLRSVPGKGCVYLSDDRMCLLHRHFGVEAKPRVCRDFPYRFRETPGGTYTRLSFVCPSVRANRGEPVAAQAQALREMRETAYSHSEITTPLPLNAKLTIAWPQYERIEQTLLEVFAHAELPLWRRLASLNILVNFIDLYWRRVSPALPGPGQTAPLEDSMLDPFLDALHRSDFADILRVTAGKPGAPLVQRMFLGMITSFGNTVFRPHSRFHVLTGIVLQYMRHATGLGGWHLRGIEGRTPHAQLHAAVFPSGGEAMEMLERYVRHCIFRKDLVYRCSLERGVNLLILNMALVRWYAAAAARADGRTQCVDADFSEALMHVEKLYGFHSKFYEFFAANPIVDEILDNFMRRRNYPMAMLAEPE